MRKSFLLAASVASCLFALPSDTYEHRTVRKVEIVVDSANASEETKTLLSKLKTQAGDPFNHATFDTDLKNLSVEYDRVDPSISLDAGEVDIVIHLHPRPLIHSIQFEGNEAFSTSTLRDELEIAPYTTFNRQDFNLAFGKLKEHYLKKGYFESELSYSVEPISGTNEVDIVIHVNEGRSGYIQEIVLEGFSKEEREKLFSQMFLKKYNFFTSWFTQTGSYREELLEQDKMTMVNYLQNEGFADASIQVSMKEDPETNRLILVFAADKGELYHFGEFTFCGNTLYSTEEIKKHLQIAESGIYSPEKLRLSAQAIKDFYGKHGYIDTVVDFDSRQHLDEPLFDVSFTIEEGAQYKVGLIHIIGNQMTNNNVILRESLLVPGEVFDARKLKATQQRLEAIGYFKSVNVYAVRAADDENLPSNYRDVYIEVEEQSTGNISLFSGFSSTDDINGGIDLSERNFNIAGFPKALKGNLSALRGGGQYFHIRGTIGKKEWNGLLSWMNPYVYDTLWRFGFELSGTFSTLQSDNVREWTGGGSLFTNYPITTYWTYGMRQRVRYTHSNDKLEGEQRDVPNGDADAVAEKIRKQLDQSGVVSAFSANLGYDSTSSIYKPKRGWRSYFEAEIAGLGGPFQFWKLAYLNSLYWGLSPSGILKFRFDVRCMGPYASLSKEEIPYSERYFLGGDQSVRGYKPFILGPHIEILQADGSLKRTNTPLGGNTSIFGSLEYNYEVFRQLDLFFFTDVGSVSQGIFTHGTFSPTAGAGIRLDLGNRTPIVLGWGYPLVKSKHRQQDKQPFFFSMGGQF